MTREDVLDTLAELFTMRGVPRQIRSDNGPEFVANKIQNPPHFTSTWHPVGDDQVDERDAQSKFPVDLPWPQRIR